MILWGDRAGFTATGFDQLLAHTDTLGDWKNWKSSPPATADACPNSPTFIRIITTLEYYRLGW